MAALAIRGGVDYYENGSHLCYWLCQVIAPRALPASHFFSGRVCRFVKYADQKLKTYMTHRAALVDYATPIIGCRARAEDIVQDAFLRYLPGGETPSVSGVAYLYRIVRNLAIDMLRRSAMESRHMDGNNVSWLEPVGEASPEEHLVQGDQLGRLARVLEQLPEKERLAVEMHRFGGYTLADIAARLEVSTATVHRMIRQALVQLASALDEDAPQ